MVFCLAIEQHTSSPGHHTSAVQQRSSPIVPPETPRQAISQPAAGSRHVTGIYLLIIISRVDVHSDVMKDLGCCQICDSVRMEHMGEAARPESSQHISQGSVGMQCGVWVPPSHLERIWRGSCAAFLEKALKFDALKWHILVVSGTLL